MKVDKKLWVSPTGETLESVETGKVNHPPSLIWSRRLKVVGMVALLLLLCAAPFLQFAIPRKSFLSHGGDSVEVASADSPGQPIEYIVITPTASLPFESFVTATPSPVPALLAATPVPQFRLTADCYVYDYPSSGAGPMGWLLSGSVVYPLGEWVDSSGGRWYQLLQGWLSGSCGGGVGQFAFVSPPVLRVPPFTATPRPTPEPVVQQVQQVERSRPSASAVVREISPTATPRPRWDFSPLPSGFSPGWCVKLSARSVWLPDGSRYDATKDGYVYLSEGVLGMDLTIQVGDWFEGFRPGYGCGQYR